jgi:hypothetical protein
MPSTTKLLLAALDEAFDRRSWHGTNLRGSIRGVGARDAAWRPGPRRHNVWEVVVHAAYWKYAVWRRLVGEKRGSFPLQGSNWWTRPAAGWRSGREREAEWRRDVRLLVAEHNALRAAVAAFPAAKWPTRPPGSPFTYAAFVRGITAHDLYHAGQIQLLKRLAR